MQSSSINHIGGGWGEWSLTLTHNTEINSRCIRDLNVTVKYETSRRQQENIFMALG